MTEPENKIGLPWLYIRRYKGSFGTDVDLIDTFDFDQYSTPTKDSTGHWIFSLKDTNQDVCMIRCYGERAKNYALTVVNKCLDALEQV